MLGLLRPTGLWQAVLVSSLLFGLGHLGNSVLRGLSPIIAAQAVGAGRRAWASRRCGCAPTPSGRAFDHLPRWRTHSATGTWAAVQMIQVLTMPARHGLRVRQAEPAHVTGWLAHTMRRTDQRVVEKGEEDGES